jgi:hypothetical protein
MWMQWYRSECKNIIEKVCNLLYDPSELVPQQHKDAANEHIESGKFLTNKYFTGKWEPVYLLWKVVDS